MCGIVAFIDENNEVVDRVISGLKKLEYRGYDSAGIAINSGEKLERIRSVGKISNLEKLVINADISSNCAIGHTRWATHGAATEINAHPHKAGDIVMVHNGIIENYMQLRDKLTTLGITCEGESDTEVITLLLSHYYQQENDIEIAFFKLLDEIEGAFSLVVMVRGINNFIIATRKGSPLTLGVDTNNPDFSNDPQLESIYVASDPIAYAEFCTRWTSLPENHSLIFRNRELKILNHQKHLIKNLDWHSIEPSMQNISKGDHRHFMIKEIKEQPEVLAHSLSYYFNASTNEPRFIEHDNNTINPEIQSGNKSNTTREVINGFDFNNYDRIKLIACGTAYHAAVIASYQFEQLAKIPAQAELASEYRYRQPVIEKNTLAIFVSQSGETADTLSAMRYCAEEAECLAVVNVESSALAREANWIAPLKVGREIGVASTKAFTAMLCSLGSLVIYAAIQRNTISQERKNSILEAVPKLPRILSNTISSLEQPVKELANKIAEKKFVIYLGRNRYYPLALEGALKLKEISYIHAHGYAAGELKHGPIALIEDGTAVVSIIDDDELVSKVSSNLSELLARRGWVIAIGPAAALGKIDEDGEYVTKLEVPKFDSFWMPVVFSLPIQLLAYYTAVKKGTDVDQPRNLAKSVTVE